MDQIKCEVCGKVFDAKLPTQKYCTPECRKIGQNLAARRHYVSKHTGEFNSEVYKKTLMKALADIRKKSTLDKDLRTLKQDGDALGLKSYEYGKYARIKGL